MLDNVVNHFAAVVLVDGVKVRGFDYASQSDAEEQAGRLRMAGYQTEVWPMNCFGQRLLVEGQLAA